MTVRCDRCDKSIGPEDWEPKSALAQCQACGLVFELLHKPSPPASSRPIARKRGRPRELPEHVEAELEDPEPLAGPPLTSAGMVPYRDAALAPAAAPRLARASARAFIRVPSGFIRRSEVIGWSITLSLLSTGLIAAAWGSRAVIFFIAVTALLGVTALWNIAAGLLNRTTVRLADGVISIRIGPIPVSGAVDVSAADVEQIWTRMVRTVAPGDKRGPSVDLEYNVELRLTNGATIVLVRGLDRRDQALYIEQALEHALGIIDVAVFEEERTDPADLK